jgi:DNA polymerase-3 subunit gamma/tau
LTQRVDERVGAKQESPVSYQVIARKWRPQNFDEVTGQEHVTTSLRNAIRMGRIPHAVLLAGPRGVGKTTLARILARSINCDQGPTDSPCGSCSPCAEIANGSSTDVQEIDAASRTGVDNVRELIESIQYSPSPGKYRIFVVDEVHMLSKPAFNALLKTLEEPPPNSLFVFATTEPEKIPFTVLSRCQRYDLRLFASAEVCERLAQICRAEEIQISENSLRAVAREGQGSMRDSQTLLDQIIASGGTEVDDETVNRLLDLVDRRLVFEILEACIDAEPEAALEACRRATQSGADAKRLSASLLQSLRDLVVLCVAPKATELVEGGEAEIEVMRALAKRGGAERLRRMFKALVREQEDLSWAPQPFAVLEMGLIRLATLPSGEDVGELLQRLKTLERNLERQPAAPRRREGSGQGSGEGHGEGGGVGQSGASASKAASSPSAPQAIRDAGGSEESAVRENAARDSETRQSAAPESEATTDDGRSPASPAGDAPAEVILDRLRVFAQKSHRGLFASLEDAKLLAHAPGSLRVAIPTPFHHRRLEQNLDAFRRIAEEFFGRPTRIELLLEAGGNSSAEPHAPDASKNDPRRERERKQRQQALNHPAINEAIQTLKGEIVEIRPLGGEIGDP